MVSCEENSVGEGSPEADPAVRITSYEALLTIADAGDGSLAAQETLTVEFDDSEHHGIFRDFSGEDYPVSDATGTLDGAPSGSFAAGVLGGRLTLGAADTTLSAGEHEFGVDYSANGVLEPSTDVDGDLQFDAAVIESDWALDIADVEVTIAAACGRARHHLRRRTGSDGQHRRRGYVDARRHRGRGSCRERGAGCWWASPPTPTSNSVDVAAATRESGGVTSYISHTTVDCRNAYELSEWWKPVLGYTDIPDDPNEPGHEECMITDPDTGHAILFIETPDAKSGKNRLHFDLRPREGTRDEELERLLAHGATEVADLRGTWGPGCGWVVLADPEGNEFCILRSVAEAGQPG